MQHLLLAPVYLIGAVALAAIGKTLYDAVSVSTHLWGMIGLIVLATWLSLAILYAMSRP